MSSLYVHIPFCDHICSYCDFSKVLYRENKVDAYLEALSYELEDKQIKTSFDTIYIGGGTPSSLTLSQLTKLFELLKPYSNKVKEYSIEVNPESMNIEKIQLMHSYGINRISIGVQTFNDKLLKKINRYHSSKMVYTLIQQIKDVGINDINVDLMYGLPDQTYEDIIDDLHIIDTLELSHVSVYSLILEDHTVLKNINYQPLDEETDRKYFETICKKLKEMGYEHYEVSNFYRLKPSYHNTVYWHYEDYEAIGLGAHSKIKNQRFENTRSLDQYLNHQYLLEKEKLEDDTFTRIMVGLRLKEGIDLDLLRGFENQVEKYVQSGLMEIKDDKVKLTFEGLLIMDAILLDFMA